MEISVKLSYALPTQKNSQPKAGIVYKMALFRQLQSENSDNFPKNCGKVLSASAKNMEKNGGVSFPNFLNPNFIHLNFNLHPPPPANKVLQPERGCWNHTRARPPSSEQPAGFVHHPKGQACGSYSPKGGQACRMNHNFPTNSAIVLQCFPSPSSACINLK